MIWTAAFWKAAGERAVKTFAQSLVAVGLSNATGLLDVNWVGALSAAGLATVLSVLTSVAGSGVNGPGPSVANEKISQRGAGELGLIVGVLLVVILVVVLLRLL